MEKSIELTDRAPAHHKRELSAADRLVLDLVSQTVPSPRPEDLDSTVDLYGSRTIVDPIMESANQLVADVVDSVPLPELPEEFDSFEEDGSRDTGNQPRPLDMHTIEHFDDLSEEESPEVNQSRPFSPAASALMNEVVGASMETFIPDPSPAKAFVDEVIDESMQASLTDASANIGYKIPSTQQLVALTIADVLSDGPELDEQPHVDGPPSEANVPDVTPDHLEVFDPVTGRQVHTSKTTGEELPPAIVPDQYHVDGPPTKEGGINQVYTDT